MQQHRTRIRKSIPEHPFIRVLIFYTTELEEYVMSKQLESIALEFYNGDQIQIDKKYVNCVLIFDVKESIDYTNDQRLNNTDESYSVFERPSSNDILIIFYEDADEHAKKLYKNNTGIKDESLFKRLQNKNYSGQVSYVILNHTDKTQRKIKTIMEFMDSNTYNHFQTFDSDIDWGVSLHITDDIAAYDEDIPLDNWLDEDF